LFAEETKKEAVQQNIFKNDSRFKIRSAGLSPKSERKITENDILWSDLIFVMETNQRNMINEVYGHINIPKTVSLEIPDDYEYLDEELIALLEDRMNDSIKSIYSL
jgi:predicted protein tyrosine phosphatase